VPAKIANPDYKGKWTAPLIDNPAYKGEWRPRLIPNVNYFEDDKPYALPAMGAIGIELWTMQNNIEFDNIYIGKSEEAARSWADATWGVKSAVEQTAIELELASEPGAIGNALTFLVDNPLVLMVTSVVIIVCIALIFILCCGDSESDQRQAVERAEKEIKAAQPESKEAASADEGEVKAETEGSDKQPSSKKND